MSAYADTSFLYSLYVQQAHSANAAAYVTAAHNAALPLTTLGRFELLNAIRLSVFRQQLNPRVAAIDVLTIKADIESGVLGVISCDWAAVHAEAERLSARHTAEGGHRSMDILHVATADSDAKPANWIHGDIQIIPKGCKDPKAAADFVFFTGGVNDPQGYAQRVTWGDRPINIPVSKSVLKEPSFQKVIQNYPGFQTYIDALFNSGQVGSPPVMPAAAFYADRLQSTVQQVMLMQAQPKAALQSLTEQVQQQMQMMGEA